MLVGTGNTICIACGHVVPVAFGFCIVCDEVFPVTTLNREVAECELMEAA